MLFKIAVAVAIDSQIKFTENLFHYILARTVGTHPKDLEVFVKPSRRFIVGNLAARKHEHVDKEYEGRSSIRARRLKVSTLIGRGQYENFVVTVEASGLIFYPVYNQTLKNTVDQETTPEDDTSIDEQETGNKKTTIWKRKKFLCVLEFKLPQAGEVSQQIDFSKCIEDSENDKSDTIDFSIWDARISIERTSYDQEKDLITINFTNDAIEPIRDKSKRKDRMQERTLFDCKLRCNLNEINVQPFLDEYKYNNNLQRYFYYFRTVNCQAYWLDKTFKEFATEHYGRYDQENVIPRQSINNIDLGFHILSNKETMLESMDALIVSLEEFAKTYKRNYEMEHNDNDAFQPRIGSFQKTWKERESQIEQYDLLLSKLRNGIEEIKTDDIALNSFLHMNKTFNEYYMNRGIDNGKWRLFQLIFLITVIPSVTKNANLDIVDILHVNTGGGKSEAYFALVVFSMFYERAKGKKDGVTAIVKFPLRMLSIQQLERISAIIIYAEKVRIENKEYFPGSEFSLGYFIGESEDFPKNYKDIRKKLYVQDVLKTPAPPSIIISQCPLCPKSDRGIVRLIDDVKSYRIIHQCDKCQNQFYIYSTSKEIYRWRPTVIVSTVDKWAGIDQQLRTRNLLGGRGSMCQDGHGFIASGDECEKNNRNEYFLCKNMGNDSISSSGPILSIQDEMHLLSEGFGTISAHFEGLVEAMIEETSSKKLKHVTMSATLNGAGNQAKQLYNKSGFVIPGRCPETIGGSTDPFFEKKDGPKRIIFGLKPNLRDNHYAALRTILHYSEFILDEQKKLNDDFSNFKSSYGINNKEDGQELINQYLVPLTYHIKKQDAYDMQRLEKEVIIEELNPDTNNTRTIYGVTLTGDSSLEDLKKCITSIRDFVKSYDPESDNKGEMEFRPVYATSVVSHGIDLDELNFMVFQGLPYSTAEYIQALSRVGRKNLGIVVLWFYPNRVRDDSFYRNFNRYHETLDHQVKPIPINRSSKLGLYQTLNSIFCAGIINYLSNKLGQPLIHKRDVKLLDKNNKKDLERFIVKCYTGSDSKGSIDIENIGDEIDDRLQQIIESADKDNTFFPNILTESGYFYYRNQSGMRGIQEELLLRLDQQDDAIVWSRRKSN